MIAVFHDGSEEAPLLERLHLLGEPVQVWRDWQAFANAAGHASATIAIIPHLEPPGNFDRLCNFKIRRPHLPVVLLTRPDPEGLIRLKDIVLEEVLLAGRLADLEAALLRCRAQARLKLLAHEFEERADLPSKLREAFAYACEALAPVATVEELARVVGVNRKALRDQWIASRPPELRNTDLKDVLDWILLLRAAGLKTPEAAWKAVVRRLGITRGRLDSISRRLLGTTVAHQKGAALAAIRVKFRQRMLVHLLPDIQWDEIDKNETEPRFPVVA